MNTYIQILLILLIGNSCISTNNFLTDKKINQKLTSESTEVKITTTVEKYSRSKKWFYGKIEIENKTDKNLRFNFNQNIEIDGMVINADWNVYPVSYAQEAFKILPKSKASWDVVWRKEYFNLKSTTFIIMNDLTTAEFIEK